MKAYNRFSHLTFNIALSCFILSCIPKYLEWEGTDLIFTVGAAALSLAFLIKAFESTNK
jgi:hypothetical protein